MNVKRSLVVLAILAVSPAQAQDAEDDVETPAAETAEAQEEGPKAETVNGAKMLSGMSILGNEETPKSLVIVPWKSSEMGDEMSLSDTLDDRARPVDKEVFLRELRFYELRAAE
jgi:hypothetical protein